jgi:glycine dehydrogenase
MSFLETQENSIASLAHPDRFVHRHIGPNATEPVELLKVVGYDSVDALADAAVPKGIRLTKPLDLPAAQTEFDALRELKAIASQNQVFRSFIGQGYYDTITPPVIQRNVLENPGWYTQYTPYQAEISQGRPLGQAHAQNAHFAR